MERVDIRNADAGSAVSGWMMMAVPVGIRIGPSLTCSASVAPLVANSVQPGDSKRSGSPTASR